MRRLFRIAMIFGLLVLGAACTNISPTATPTVPTATLPLVATTTPRYTATPISSATPRPTFTFTPSITPIPPSPSNTPTVTPTPPITGSISSVEANVNMREGPGFDFSIFQGVPNNTDVIVLSASEDAIWFNVRLEDGTEGWISASLVNVQASPTPIPSETPEGMVLLVSGTPVATSLFGGQPITATPSGTVTEADGVPTLRTPGTVTVTSTVTPTETPGGNIPTVTRSFSGTLPPTATPTITVTVAPTSESATTDVATVETDITATTETGATPTSAATDSGTTPGVPRSGLDVLALCDQFGDVPQGLAAGSTIDVYWAWLATERQYIDQHLDSVIYQIRLDNILLRDLNRYMGNAEQIANGDWAIYWYVPIEEPLTSGTHTITYQASWNYAITDGYQQYGPGTNNEVETGSCTFEVR